jgi:cytochrome b involved in lipid metabolism
LPFQIGQKEEELSQLKGQMALMAEQNENDKMTMENGGSEEYEKLLTEANAKIEELLNREAAKEKTIEELHHKLSEAFETALENDGHREERGQNDLSEEQETAEALRREMAKMEQKLTNAIEEKEYYKKHFKAEHPNGSQRHNQHLGKKGGKLDTLLWINFCSAQNGHGGGQGYTDDFAKELMAANKRKYQLESRVKQVEMELKEAQQVNWVKKK